MNLDRKEVLALALEGYQLRIKQIEAELRIATMTHDRSLEIIAGRLRRRIERRVARRRAS